MLTCLSTPLEAKFSYIAFGVGAEWAAWLATVYTDVLALEERFACLDDVGDASGAIVLELNRHFLYPCV